VVGSSDRLRIQIICGMVLGLYKSGGCCIAQLFI
jgi:hypothetical protein